MTVGSCFLNKIGNHCIHTGTPVEDCRNCSFDIWFDHFLGETSGQNFRKPLYHGEGGPQIVRERMDI